MNSCLPTTSSRMNQPPPETRQIFCSRERTLTPDLFSIARRCSLVSVMCAGAKLAPAKITCCASSTLRYTVACEAGANTASGAATKIGQPRMLEGNAEPHAKLTALVVLAVHAPIDDVF